MSIVHNEQTQRFELEKDGFTAYLSYEQVDNTTLDYQHTIVPEQLGGQGIGSQLVDFALKYAQQQQFKVIASCSFVARYIEKHPEYAPLMA